MTLAVPNPVRQLSEALAILADRLREAVAERRTAPAGSERWRRGEKRIAYVNELYLRLQRRMEVPAEIWSLGDRSDLAPGESVSEDLHLWSSRRRQGALIAHVPRTIRRKSANTAPTNSVRPTIHTKRQSKIPGQ